MILQPTLEAWTICFRSSDVPAGTQVAAGMCQKQLMMNLKDPAGSLETGPHIRHMRYVVHLASIFWQGTEDGS